MLSFINFFDADLIL